MKTIEQIHLTCTRGEQYEYTNTVNGAQYFSVSQVLDVLDPHAFDDVDYEILEGASYRGARIHHIFSRLLASQIGLWPADKLDCPEQFRGYVRSLVLWIQANQVKPVKIEQPSHHPVLPVAGRPDCEIIYGPQRRLVLVDLKTGKGLRRAHRVQLQAYRQFLHYQHLTSMMTLYAQRDGSKAREIWCSRDPHDEAWFLNGVNVLIGRTYA